MWQTNKKKTSQFNLQGKLLLVSHLLVDVLKNILKILYTLKYSSLVSISCLSKNGRPRPYGQAKCLGSTLKFLYVPIVAQNYTPHLLRKVINLSEGNWISIVIQCGILWEMPLANLISSLAFFSPSPCACFLCTTPSLSFPILFSHLSFLPSRSPFFIFSTLPCTLSSSSAATLFYFPSRFLSSSLSPSQVCVGCCNSILQMEMYMSCRHQSILPSQQAGRNPFFLSLPSFYPSLSPCDNINDNMNDNSKSISLPSW